MAPAREVRSFHMRRCIGRGGFGEVYRATMTSPGGVQSEVAVKVLHSNLDPRSQAVQRLRDEGRLLGLLNHPGIVHVVDLVVMRGRVALVTEFVDGGDLDACLRGTDPLSLRASVEVIGRVADALGAAWTARGPDGEPLHLVHRDVKPANIRIGRHGEVKLLDFGIAKAEEPDREAKTQTNAVMGSFGYLAPERFEAGNTQPASDVFSLGATLYEAAAGERLFEGMSVKEQYVETLDHERFAAFVKRRLEGVEGSVRDLVAGMLEFEPAARPDASQVATRCDALAAELSGPTLRTWCRHHHFDDAGDVEGRFDGQQLDETLWADVGDGTAWDMDGPALPPPPPPSRLPWLMVAAALAFALVIGLFGVGAGSLGLWTWWGSDPVDPQAVPEPVPVTAPATVPDPVPATDVTEPGSDVVEPGSDVVEPAPAAPAPVEPRPAPAPAVPTPAPLVAPAPTAVPEPAAPAPVAMGTVTVVGDPLPVELIRDGRRFAPGALPVGTYAVEVQIDGTPVPVGTVSVTAGATIPVTCHARFKRCTLR